MLKVKSWFLKIFKKHKKRTDTGRNMVPSRNMALLSSKLRSVVILRRKRSNYSVGAMKKLIKEVEIEKKTPNICSLCDLILDIESETYSEENDALELAYECLREVIDGNGDKKTDEMSAQHSMVIKRAIDCKKTIHDSILNPSNDDVVVEEATYEEFLKTVRNSGYELNGAVLSDGSKK